MSKINKIRLRGFMFVFSLIALTTLAILGLVSLSFSASNYLMCTTQRDQAEALTLAAAAADMGEAYLRAQSSLPTTVVDYPTTGTISFSTGTCHAVVTPVTDPTNVWVDDYVIVGYGTSKRMGITHKVVMQMSPESFTQYGYCENVGSPLNWWVSGISSFDGPFHTNSTLNIDWSSSATTSDIIFNGPVSSSASTITWYSGGQTPTTSAQWNTVAAGGQAAITLGADTVPFPTVSTTQAQAAWGSTSWPTTQAAAGTYVNPPNGIYINAQGQPVNIVFSEGSTVNTQVITIQDSVYVGGVYKSQTTQVTENLVAGTTSVATMVAPAITFSTPTVYNSLLNGVLFSSSSITSLSGTLAQNYVSNGLIVNPNYWTIGTEFSTATQATTTITGNLVYDHLPDYVDYSPTSNYNLSVPALGLISYQNIINNSAGYVKGVHDNLSIDGVLMGLTSSAITSGSQVANAALYDADIGLSRLRGNINIYGGTICGNTSILGEFTGANTLQYGYNENYSYDARMASGPLTAFPATNQFAVVSYQVE